MSDRLRNRIVNAHRPHVMKMLWILVSLELLEMVDLKSPLISELCEEYDRNKLDDE